MPNKISWATCLAISLFQNFAAGQSFPKYYWYYYIVDRAKPIGGHTTLAYDKKGLPNIGYCSPSGKGPLKFAHFDGAAWQIMQVDPKGGGRIKMALDSLDQPHFVYGVDDQSTIVLASYTGRDWTIRTVHSTPYRGKADYDRGLQVDARGRIHVFYGTVYPVGNQLFHQLAYVLFDGATSSVPIRIDSVGHFGKWASMVLDALGRPTVAYYYTSLADLAVAYLDSNRWKIENLDHDRYLNNQGFYPSIQRDQQNNFYISFQNQNKKMLRLAYGRSGAWTMEDITTLSGWTTYTTPNPLALDKQDNPYVAFYDQKNGDLKLAYKLQNAWHIETVDSIGRVGEYASIAINLEGLPAISYYDSTQGFLRLAVASLTPPPDTDGDLIADYLESSYGADSRDVDSDDDGLSDGEEDLNHNGLVEKNETDPTKPDSDGDGVLDGVEVGRVTGVKSPPGMKGTDPLRFHGDADPNTKTDPLLVDTDSDGLSDGQEDRNANGRVDFDETDPNNPDTDGDHIADGLEVRQGTSPLDIDSDDDGLADGTEDKNFNGVLDDRETDPRHADTDNDGLPDGLELGVTKPLADPDGPGKFLATDAAKFLADLDPATTTNPRQSDTDNDGIKDGDEDKNRNGRFETGETNPLNADTDGDKLRDGTEIIAGTNPLDLDSDDDGLADGAEDANLNGVVDVGETSPRLFDTDGDGLSDGLELGATVRIPDPDGNGPLRGTEGVAFIPDTNPSVNSNPLLWDSDNDGLSDGEEDVNRNGAIETGETHFLTVDTDADGLSDGDEKSFKSNPLDPRSKAEIAVLLKNNFSTPDLRAWTIVDEGANEAPSDWLVYDGALLQASNIWGGADIVSVQDPYRPGTYIWAKGLDGTNYKVTFKLRSSDDDEMGFMFHYRDSQNYYRFSMNAEQRYRRITKIVNGQASVITSQDFAYQPNHEYEAKVFAVDGRLQIYLDGRRVFDIQDNVLKNGSIAFYCWRNSGTAFRDLLVIGQGKTVAVHDPNEDTFTPDGRTRRQFSLSPTYPNPTSEMATFVLQATFPVVLQYKIFDLLGKTVRNVEDEQYPAGLHQIVWNGKNNTGEIVPSGIYFMHVVASNAGDPDQILWNEVKKIVWLP